MADLDAISEILTAELGGEPVTHCTQVLLESSVGRLSADIVTGGAGGGLKGAGDDLGKAFTPGGYLAVTPTRLFALGQTAMRARPKDFVFCLNRSGLEVERGRKRLMGLIKLDTITLTQGEFTITFHIPKNAKKDGLAVLEALGT